MRTWKCVLSCFWKKKDDYIFCVTLFLLFYAHLQIIWKGCKDIFLCTKRQRHIHWSIQIYISFNMLWILNITQRITLYRKENVDIWNWFTNIPWSCKVTNVFNSWQNPRRGVLSILNYYWHVFCTAVLPSRICTWPSKAKMLPISDVYVPWITQLLNKHGTHIQQCNSCCLA